MDRWAYQEINATTFILSVVIIFTQVAFYFICQHEGLLPVLFRSVTRRKRRLLCFDVNVTFSKDGKTVQNYLNWLIRTVIVVVLCFLWQTLVVSYTAYDLNKENDYPSLVKECQGSSSCYGSDSTWKFFVFWYSPQEVCHDGTISAIINRENVLQISPYFVCIRWVAADTLLYTEKLAIAFALCQMVVILSEVMVWILLETSYYKLWSWTIVLVSVVFFACLIGSMFIATFFTFFTSWLGFAELLSVPLILMFCRGAADNLRRIRKFKIKIWKARAERPINQLEEEDLFLESGTADEMLQPQRPFEVPPSSPTASRTKRARFMKMITPKRRSKSLLSSASDNSEAESGVTGAAADVLGKSSVFEKKDI